MAMNTKNQINIGVNFDVNKASLSEITKSLNDIQNSISKQAKSKNGLTDELKEAQTAAVKLKEIVSSSWNSNLGQVDIAKLNKGIIDTYGSVDNLKKSLAGAGQSGINAFNSVAKGALDANNQLKKTNATLDKFATTLKNTIRYGISSSIFNGLTNGINQAWSYSKRLDTSLNDIRIVTGKSADEMERFAQQANSISKSLNASTLDYTKAALIYAQQGLDDEEVMARAETTVKAANVTGQSGSVVSEQLTAVWNGYNATAEETEGYVDKLAAVAASTAADLEELSVGMSKVAAAANAMGVDFDDLNAQIATIVSVTRQAPESVGTALKTIYARLGDLKVDGVDEFGVSLGEVSGKLEQMGIQVLDQEGNMRDMTSIMKDVAAQWNTWTEAQKQAAAVAMAGKRQYNNLIALFENWDTMYTNALNTSKNAYGTLQEQQDIYADSVEAHLQKMRTEAERTYDILFDTDSVNGFASAVTVVLDRINDFMSGLGGGLKTISFIASTIVGIFHNQIGKEVNRISTNIQGWKAQREALKAGQDITTSLSNNVMQNLINDKKASGENITVAVTAGLQKQAEIRTRSLQVAEMLTEEERQQLKIEEETAGKIVEEIQLNKELVEESNKYFNSTANRKQIKNTLREAGVSDKDINAMRWNDPTKALEKGYQNINNEITKIQKNTQSLNVFNEQWMTASQLTDENYSKIINKARTLLDSGALLVSDYEIIQSQIGILNNNLADTTDKENAVFKINDIIEKSIQRQNDGLVAQEKNLNIIGEALERNANRSKAREDNIKLGIQSEAQDKKIDQTLRSAEQAKKYANIAKGISMVGMAASAAAGALTTFGDATSTGEDKVNSLFSAATGLGSALMMVSPLWGMAITGAIQLGKAILDVTGVTDKWAVALMSTDEKLEKLNQHMKETREASNSFKSAKQQLEDIEEEYDKLSRKAGEYDKNVDSLTDEQRRRYNELKDIILQYNEEAIIGYNERGEAIISENEGIQSTIELLKEEYEERKRISYLENKETDFSAKTAKYNEAKTSFENETSDVNSQQYIDSIKSSIGNMRMQYGNTTNADLFDQLDKLTSGDLDFITKNQKKIQKTMQDIIKLADDGTKELIEKDNENLNNIIQSFDDRADNIAKMASKLDQEKRIDSGYFTEALKVDPSTEANYDDFEKLGKENGIQSIDAYIKGFYDTKTYEDALDKDGRANADLVLQMGNDFVQEFSDALSQNKGMIPVIEDRAAKLGKEYAHKSYSAYIQAVEEEKENLFGKNGQYKGVSEGIQNAIFGTNYGNVEEGQAKLENLSKVFQDQGLFEGKNIGNLGEFFTPETIQYIDQVAEKLAEADLTTANWNEKLENTIASLEKAAEMDLIGGANTQAGDLINKIQSGELNGFNLGSDEDYQNLIGTLDELKEKYPELQEDVEMLNRSELAGTYEYIQALERVQDKLFELQISGFNQQIIDLQNDLNEIAKERDEILENKEGLSEEEIEIKLEANDEEFYDVISDILDANYQIDIAIHAEAEQEFNSITSMLDNMESMASKIGENFIVAASDLRELNNAFPGILNGMEQLADGSIKLNQDVVQSAMQGAEAEAQASAKSAISRIQAEIEVLESKRACYQAIADAANILAEDETGSSEKSAQARAIIDKNLNELEELNSKTKADAVMLNQQEIADSSNENAGIAAQNWNSSADSAANSYYLAASQMIANMNEVAKATENPGSGAAIPAGGINARYHGKGGSAKTATQGSGLSNSVDTSSAAAAKKTAKAAQAAADATERQINDMKGMIAEASALASGVDKTFGNVASGKGASPSGGGGGKKGGGGGGKEITPKEEKAWNDEFDRYYDYNNLIEKTEQSLKDLNREKEKAGRLELVRVLDKENKVLLQQIQNYKALAEAQKAEAAELQGILKGFGAEFNEAGDLTNYAQVTASALATYNDAIAKYNTGQISDDSLKTYEKDLENFKKTLERYNTLIYKDMIENSEKIKDAMDKQIENNIKGWEVEIEVKLEKSQLERDLRDVRKLLKKEFGRVYEDVTVTIQDTMDDFFSRLSDRATLEDAMASLRKEIDIIEAGGESSIFGTNLEKAKDEYKDLAGQYKETIEGAADAFDEAWDKYIEGIEHAKERFDQLNDDIDYHVEMLEFAKELNELLYKDSPMADMDMYYRNMDTYYQEMKEANLTSLDAANTQVDMWEQLWRDSGATLENRDQWNEDQERYYEYWQEAQKDVNRLTLEGAKIVKEEYLYNMQKAMDNLEDSLTNGLGFDEVQRQWDLIKEKSDKYFDDVEKVYEVESLANKFDAEINKTTGLKNQQRLKKVRDELIDQLRSINDLTEYDLQMAEARYDLELKQMALEDARNSKNSVKLVRNDQGNWSYQYVSDLDEIETKQQEMLDAWYKLYELPSEAYQKNIEARMKLDQEFYQQLEKINNDEKASAEEKEKRRQELAAWYYKEVDALAEENAKYQNDLAIGTTGVLITTYDNDKDAYEGMTQEEKDLVDTLSKHKIDSYDEVKNAIESDYDSIGTKTKEVLEASREDWSKNAGDIIDFWTAPSTGIQPKVDGAFDAMGQSAKGFETDIYHLQDSARIDFGSMDGYMKTVGESIDNLSKKTTDLKIQGQKDIAELNQSILSIKGHWDLVKTSIEDNLRLINEYMQKQKQVNEAPPPSPVLPETTPVNTRTAQDIAPNTTGGNPGGGTNGTPGGSTQNTAQTTRQNTHTTRMSSALGYHIDYKDWNVKENGKWVTYKAYMLKSGDSIVTDGAGNKMMMIDKDRTYSSSEYNQFLKSVNAYAIQRGYSGYDTGGYTGSWDDNSGRWAMLHQKELVLNKEDTENFLSGIKMIRDMSSINGSVNKAIIQSIATVISNIAGTSLKVPGTGNTNSNQNQVFNITAEFPNANDVNEIREAILSLPNLAAQYVMSKEMD